MTYFLKDPKFEAEHRSESVPSPTHTEEWAIEHFDYSLMVPYTAIADRGPKYVQELAAKSTLDQLFADLVDKPKFFDVQMEHDVPTGHLKILTRVKMMRKVK